jgi:hypothetical protein
LVRRRAASDRSLGAMAHRPQAAAAALINQSETQMESHMYIGGLLGTVLVILLIVYLVRRV